MNRRQIGWVGLLCIVSLGCGTKPETKPTSERSSLGDIAVTIEFPDGKDSIKEVVDSAREGDTVLDVLQQLKLVSVESHGTGGNAFVTKIGDLETSAGEGWLFYVNDQWADRGAGAFELHKGDTVRWKYGSFSE